MVKRIFYELKLQNIQRKIWTTDARYCETKAKLEARKAEFCEVSIVTVDQIIKDIAQLEYSLFVVNSYAAGIQQNDGRYITKYFPMSPFVIEQMLKRQGSMGCYQQGYRTNRIKWICFDFDCKEKVEPDVYDLYNQCIVPFTQMLDEFGIHYMMEFSGRRGIHLLRRCGLEQNLLVQFEELNEKTAVSDIRITVNKEKAYLKDNDEVPDVSVWNRLCNLKQYDLQFYDALVGNIVRGEKIEYVPDGYKVYKRIESSDKIRTLVSLSAKDRVITTNLALRLCSGLKMNWKSFSYHVSYTSQEQIFYYWYSSWGRFIDHIRVFTEIPFMDNYEVFYIDLKGFYDHIDFMLLLKLL